MSDPQIHMVTLGYISKAHGIKGELSVVLFAESLSVLSGELILEKNENPTTRKRVKVAAVRKHHGGAILLLEQVKDRNAAELLKGYSIMVERNELPELDEEEIYQADILGLKVFVLQPNNAPPLFLGTITSIDAPAGQELWTITTENEKEVLLPAVPEFVLDINLDDEQVLIDPPTGLLDLFLVE